MPRRATDAGIGDVPPRPIAPSSPGLRRIINTHKRAESATNPRDVTLSQAKPTVKRANTFDKLKPRTWTKGAVVAAPAPPSSPNKAEDIEIHVPQQFLNDDDGEDSVGLSTGTFHGLPIRKPKTMFPSLGKRKPATRPPLSERVSMESYISSVETVGSSGESSETTCVDSLPPSPDPSLSSRMLPAQKPSPTLPLPALPNSAAPSPIFDGIPKNLHRDAAQAHNVIVQPSPLRADVLAASMPLERGEDWEAQVRPVTSPSRPSSAPFGSLEPEDNPVEDEYWKNKSDKPTWRVQGEHDYQFAFRSIAERRLQSGEDIDFFLYKHMSDEQKAQLSSGLWIWVDDIRTEGKWVKDPKKWAKRVKKVKKEEEKVQGKADKS